MAKISSSPEAPRRGEVWTVELNPTQGSEMSKKRPALVVSSDAVGILPIKLAAPITGWQAKFERCPWLVLIEPDDVELEALSEGLYSVQLQSDRLISAKPTDA
jgi:mRNA interferase MazF